MLEKIKQHATTVLGFLVVILGGILFNRNRKLQKVESELRLDKANGIIKETDNERTIAKEQANDAVRDYERLKREYESGGRGDDV